MNLYFLMFKCIVFYQINVLHFVGSSYPKTAQFCLGRIPCAECGICKKESVEEEEEICDTSYFAGQKPTDYFQVNKDTICERKDMCTLENACHNNVSCTPLFGSYDCNCNEGYYGQDCSSQIEPPPPLEDIAKGISVMYAPFSEAMDLTFMMVAMETPGINLKIEFDNGMGLTSIQTISAARYGNATKICLDCGVAPYRFCQFLTKDYINTTNNVTMFVFRTVYPIYRRGDSIVDDGQFLQDFIHFQYKEGRKYELAVRVKNNLELKNWKPLQFSQKYSKFILFKKRFGQDCLPKLHMTVCSRDGKDVPSFFRTAAVTFDASAKPGRENCTYQKIMLRLMLWKIVENFDESDKPLLNRYQQSYTLKPFGMEGGKYVMKLVGEMVVDRNKKLFNFMYCFFDIAYKKLNPIIDGGDFRNANYKNDIVLDVSRTINPNEVGGESKLRFAWKCEPKLDIPMCDGTPRSQNKYVIPGPFDPNKKYNFTVTASTEGGEDVAESKSQVIVMSSNNINTLLLRCWRNCGGGGFVSTTHEIVYLEALFHEGSSMNPGEIIKWKYKLNGVEMDNITVLQQSEATPDSILIVDEEKMEKQAVYEFFAHGHLDEMALYIIKTSIDPKIGNCTVTPLNGTMGVTIFTISCIGYKTNQIDDRLVYEIYDNKPFEDHEGPGMYVGETMDGTLNVTLVGGNVTIHIMDTLCMFVEENHIVIIISHTFEQFEISQMISQVQERMVESDKIGVMRLVAILAETATYTTSKLEDMTKTLSVVNQIRGTDVGTLKLLGSGLSNYLKLMVAHEKMDIGPNATQLAGYIIEYVGNGLLPLYTDATKDEIEIESRSIRQIARYIAECAESILQTKNTSILNYSVMTYAQENVVNQFKDGFTSMIHSLEMAAQSGGFWLMPYQRIFTTVTPTIFMWARLCRETMEMAEYIERNPYLDVRLSQKMAEEVDKNPGNLILEVVTMKKNPFWWYRGCYNVVEATVASIKLRKKFISSKKIINKLTNPLFIYLNLSTIPSNLLTGTTYFPNSEDDFETKSAAVSVNRIETNIGSKLFLQFHNVSQSLKVVVLKNMIPDYDYMEELGIDITANNSVYDVQDMLTNSESFFYVGVLPANKSNEEEIIPFTFEVITANCMTWHTTILGRRCEVLLDSTLKRLHCACGHFSVITGSKISAEQLTHKEISMKFTMKSETNLLLFICIPVIFLLYGLIFLWAMYKDRKDKVKESVVLLDDNYPGDSFGYLITVYTGSRILAGTNANVGVRLFGRIHDGRAHILRSSKYKTMQRYNDDWFLLFTPAHLGEIHHIHVWHDNSGRFPDWFCDKIIVYDLEARVEYIFPVNQWLAPKVQQYLEVYMAPVQKKDVDTFPNLTLENTVLCFRDTHIWASVGNRHPRTEMTRTDRVAVCMCFVMLSLLLTAACYFVIEDPEDDPSLELSIKVLLVVFVSAVIISPIIYLILLLFRFLGVKKINKEYVEPEEKNVHLAENNVPSEGTLHHHHHVNVSKSKATMHEAKNVDLSKNTETVKKSKLNYYFKINELRPVWLGPLDDNKEVKHPKTSRSLIPCIICQAVIVFCAIVVIFLGMQLAKCKTEKWLLTAGFVILQDIFLFLPLKMFLLSIILGYYNRKLFYVETYDFNYEEAKRNNMVGNNDYLFELEKLRSKPMYHPLSRTEVTVFRSNRKRRQSWFLLLEFLIIIMFFIVLYIYIKDIFSARFFHTNDQIQKALLHRTVNGTLSFNDVHTHKRFLEYLAYTFFPMVYKGLYINNDLREDFDTTKFGRAGWFGDEVHRLVGIPRIRQFRVVPDECKVADMIKKAGLKMRCIPNLNSVTEDTRNYKFAWNKYPWKDLDYDDEPFPSPWVYVTPEKSQSSAFHGISGNNYHDGGYIVNLGRSKRETNYTLAETFYSNWIDHKTRVVIVELQLYAVNSDSFSIVIIVVEIIPSGALLRSAKVLTLKDDRKWFFWTFIFLFFAVYFFWSIIYNLNEHGIFNCITYFWDYFEVVIFLLSFANLSLHIFHVFYMSDSIHKYHIAGKDVFFTYATLLTEYYTLLFFVFMLFMCLTIRLLRTFKFGRRVVVFYYTLQFTARSVFCITISYIIFLEIVSTIVSYTLNSPFVQTFQLFFMYKTGYHNLLGNSVFPYKRSILFIYCLSAALFSSVFIILYSYYLRIAKSYKLSKPELLNYVPFLKEELGLTDKNKHYYTSKRIRGGTDAPAPRLSQPYEMLMSLRTKQYIKYRIGQNEITGRDYLQVIRSFKEIPLDSSFGREKLVNEFLEYEKNRSQYFKFVISNFNLKLNCVISKIDDILSEEKE